MKRPLVGLIVLAVAFGVGTSAAAGAPPERYTAEFVESDTIDCFSFDPAWTFNDDFVDFFTVRGQVWLDVLAYWSGAAILPLGFLIVLTPSWSSQANFIATAGA